MEQVRPRVSGCFQTPLGSFDGAMKTTTSICSLVVLCVDIAAFAWMLFAEAPCDTNVGSVSLRAVFSHRWSVRCRHGIAGASKVSGADLRARTLGRLPTPNQREGESSHHGIVRVELILFLLTLAMNLAVSRWCHRPAAQLNSTWTTTREPRSASRHHRPSYDACRSISQAPFVQNIRVLAILFY